MLQRRTSPTVMEARCRQNAARINVRGGRALADFFVAVETQERIAEFAKARYGQSLFVPDAGKPDRW